MKRILKVLDSKKKWIGGGLLALGAVLGTLAVNNSKNTDNEEQSEVEYYEVQQEDIITNEANAEE